MGFQRRGEPDLGNENSLPPGGSFGPIETLTLRTPASGLRTWRSGRTELPQLPGTSRTGLIRSSGSEIGQARLEDREQGQLKLRVKARGKAAKQLSRRGKKKLKLNVVFEPNNCPVKTKSKKVKLLKKITKRR